MDDLVSDGNFLRKQTNTSTSSCPEKNFNMHQHLTKHRDACAKYTTRITASIPVSYAEFCRKRNIRYSYVFRKGMEAILYHS